MSFLLFFGWVSRKMDKMRKIWASSGVLRRGVVILHNNIGPRHDVACPRCGVAKREVLANLVLLFCYSEDLSIRLMRAL